MDVYLYSQILKENKDVTDHKSRDRDDLWKGELQRGRDIYRREWVEGRARIAVFYFLTWYIYFAEKLNCVLCSIYFSLWLL